MGVRESLEEQNHEHMKATAALITEQKNPPRSRAQVWWSASVSCGYPYGNGESAACEENSVARMRRPLPLAAVLVLWQRNVELWDSDASGSHSGLLTAQSVPGVYLAAALAAHSQKGIPRSPFYGHDAGCRRYSIPADVEENCCVLRAGRVSGSCA